MKQNSLPMPASFGQVRRACPADFGRILQMVRDLATHHGDTATLTPEDLARDLAGERPWITVVVAEHGGSLIGYAAMCGLIQLQFGVRGMDIHHMFTDAAHRGRGVGRSLIDACKLEAIAASCRYLTVGTHPDNHKAQQFYASVGFERRDAHPPRFVMRLDG